MALIPKNTYAGQTVGSDPNYPEGKAQNVTIAGDGTGTPLEEQWVNDLWGFLQALLDRAGISASGVADQVGTSQYLDSLTQWFGTTRNLDLQPAEISVMHAQQARAIDVSAQVTSLTGMMASDDGLFAYALDSANDGVTQYTMLDPWNGAIAVAAGPYTITEDSLPTSLFYSNENVWYALGNANDTVYRYDFGAASSIASSSYSGDFYDFSAQTTSANALTFSEDRSKFYIADDTLERIHQYTTVAPGLLAGSSYDGFMDISDNSSGGLSVRGMAWDPDGSRMLVLVSGSGSDLFEYVTGGVPFDAVGALYSGKTFDVGRAMADASQNMDDIALTQGGMKMWVGSIGEVIGLFDCGIVKTAL